VSDAKRIEEAIRECYQRLKAAPNDRCIAAELTALVEAYRLRQEIAGMMLDRLNAPGGEC
jgi:DNA-directed RNA polymerase specialized sigma subunit